MVQQTLCPSTGPGRSISPLRELGAYEVLWSQKGATFKRIADRFRAEPDALPSDFVPRKDADEMATWLLDHLRDHGVNKFGVRVHRAGEYPPKLRDARHPVEVLTYQGTWNLVEAPSIAIVGARKASDEGLRRARRLARELIGAGYTVVSGLAAGIDTATHTEALTQGAPTIAVIGTPLSETYPRQNKELQAELARNHLVISQVPIYRYTQQDYRANRAFFPERNVTMSAITQATVIVEASDTSGSLTQAKAALHQGRQLFILDSCFQRPDLSWPHKFAKRGAIRVREIDDILTHLPQTDATPDRLN